MPVSRFLCFHVFLSQLKGKQRNKKERTDQCVSQRAKVIRQSRFSCDRFKGRCLSDVFVFCDTLFIHLSGTVQLMACRRIEFVGTWPLTCFPVWVGRHHFGSYTILRQEPLSYVTRAYYRRKLNVHLRTTILFLPCLCVILAPSHCRI